MTESKKKPTLAKRIALVVLGILAVLMIGIQLIPVDRSNPPVTQIVDAPSEVMTILRRACFDCHSNETVWPWYSKIAPISWLVASDVHEAREHFNFTTWDEYDDEDRTDILDEVWEEVEAGHMPLPKYVRLHPEAVLDDADLETIKAWTGGGPRSDRDDDDHEGHDH